MTDPRELLAAQAEEIADSDTIPVLRVVQLLSLWGEALSAVLDLHPIGNPGVGAVAWCGGCGNADTAPDWPCQNVRAITAALEAS